MKSTTQSHVKVSFELPEYTGEVDALGTLKLIESYRRNCPNAKLYNACTGIIWTCTRGATERKYTILSKKSLWNC
jgi:GDPmannose 4,6-dehydratase